MDPGSPIVTAAVSTSGAVGSAPCAYESRLTVDDLYYSAIEEVGEAL